MIIYCHTLSDLCIDFDGLFSKERIHCLRFYIYKTHTVLALCVESWLR